MHVDAEFSKKMEFRNANGFDIRQEADYLSPMHNKDKGDSPSESIASLIIDHKASNSHVRIQANGIASEQAEDTGDTIYKTPDGLKIQVRDEHVFQTRFTAVDKNGNTISCSVEDEAQNCRNTITQIRLMKLRSIKDIGRYMNIPVWIKGGTRTP